MNAGKSAELHVYLFKVVGANEYLAGFASGSGGYEPIGFHHVDKTGGSAKSDPQSSLQVGDSRLTCRDYDACRLVIEVVLFEGCDVGRFFLCGDCRVVGGFPLFA